MDIIYTLLPVFVFGGLISFIAQLFIDLTAVTPARILVFTVCLGVLLYAVGAYEPLYNMFGAGISVPLTGFGAAIGKGVRSAIDEKGAIGILTGGLSASSSGITAALLLGFIFAILFKTRSKRM